MTKIEQLIAEAQEKLQSIEQEYNQNAQTAQQIQQRNRQLQDEGTAVVARINTLTELQGLGDVAFRAMEDATATPAEATKTEAPAEVESPAVVEEATEEAASRV